MNIYAEYAEVVKRISLLCSDIDEGPLVPACPDWSVRDLIAHLSGLGSDVVAGNVDGYATDQWTAAQVTQRSGRQMSQLLDEWATSLARMEATFEDVPRFVQVSMLVDGVTHEHDIRDALVLPGYRDSRGVQESLRLLIGGLRANFATAGLDTLEIYTNQRSFFVGREEPVGTLRVDGYELFRSLTGRRTRAEVDAYAWTGPHDTFLDHWLQRPFSWK